MAHLICDAQTDVDTYLIDLDGVITESPAQITDSTTGMKRLFFDLTGIAPGDHHVEVRAKNMWGQSDPAFLDFTAVIPGTPSGLSLGE